MIDGGKEFQFVSIFSETSLSFLCFQAVPLSPSAIHLYITVYRKLSMLPECGDFSFHGLEVRLVSLDRRLYDAVGSIMAVTKIVPDYQKYR